jgi:cytidylate kinase
MSVIPEKKRLIIAIDGPSGAGKSTVAKALARRLGYTYIDTGAMYRAVALKAKRGAVLLENEEDVYRWASSFHIAFVEEGDRTRVLCDGEDVTEAIRSPEVSLLASDISKRKGVREALVGMQRELGKQGGIVLEGRDIGTVVFPKAEIKFYLDADAEERARRRYDELIEKQMKVDFEQIHKEVSRRDENDMTRTHSPLRMAEDAIRIDSTDLSAEEVVEEMLRIIRHKMKNSQL